MIYKDCRTGKIRVKLKDGFIEEMDLVNDFDENDINETPILDWLSEFQNRKICITVEVLK